MKILIVNEKDIKGGSARAAFRLHKALLKIGIDSQMLVQSKFSNDPRIIGPLNKFQKGIAILRPELDKLPLKLYTNWDRTPFSTGWLPFSGIVDKINESNADIVHLHWIFNGMLRIEEMAKIQKPIVWTLHDMGAFTGGCLYDNNCGKYLRGCKYCPVLGSNKKNDLSKRIFYRKIKIYKKIDNIYLVGLSKWMVNSAKNSKLLGSCPIVNLPNPIDTDIFKPLDKNTARDILNIPLNKKFVLFGASNPYDNRKGFKELKKAINKVNSSEVELMVFGSSSPTKNHNFKFKTHYKGKLDDDISLCVLYSASDVTVVPSLQENLSNVIMESLSCGTPVVAFNIGGNGDMVEHMENGYLAKPFDSSDLALGIDYVLVNSVKNSFSKRARIKVLDRFDMELVAKKYKSLYDEILNI